MRINALLLALALIQFSLPEAYAGGGRSIYGVSRSRGNIYGMGRGSGNIYGFRSSGRGNIYGMSRNQRNIYGFQGGSRNNMIGVPRYNFTRGFSSRDGASVHSSGPIPSDFNSNSKANVFPISPAEAQQLEAQIQRYAR